MSVIFPLRVRRCCHSQLPCIAAISLELAGTSIVNGSLRTSVLVSGKRTPVVSYVAVSPTNETHIECHTVRPPGIGEATDFTFPSRTEIRLLETVVHMLLAVAVVRKAHIHVDGIIARLRSCIWSSARCAGHEC